MWFLTVEEALLQGIAAELIVKYKVSGKDLGFISREILSELKKEGLRDIEYAINEKIENLKTNNENLQGLDLNLKIKEIIEDDIEKKIESNQSLFRKLKLKRVSKDPNDVAILGAMASGKSTVKKELVGDRDVLDFVNFSVDDFRGISTDPKEGISNQRLIQTQDTAAMVKELVIKKIKKMEESGQRPSILLDGTRIEWALSNIIDKPGLKSVVVGMPDLGVVPKRAFQRAVDPDASPGDIGRFVNTKDLLAGHGSASKFLLASLPKKSNTIIYNTDIPLGQKPKKMAEFSSENEKKTRSVKVYDFQAFSSFLAKQNVNTDATSRAELYRGLGGRFTYSDTDKVFAFLKTVLEDQTVKEVDLSDQGLKVVRQADGKYFYEFKKGAWPSPLAKELASMIDFRNKNKSKKIDKMFVDFVNKERLGLIKQKSVERPLLPMKKQVFDVNLEMSRDRGHGLSTPADSIARPAESPIHSKQNVRRSRFFKRK